MPNQGKRVHILYGSQTGNSEDIAMSLSSRCVDELGLDDVECSPLNTIKKTLGTLRERASILVVVCSTTGNGDAPENALGFWREAKKRTLAKETLEGLPFCVLGLGDTNYDQFCHMGKSIDSRLNDLGAKRLFPVGCADEATGLEEVVDPWLDSALDAIKVIVSNSSSESGDVEKDSRPVVDAAERLDDLSIA
jgi:methionine synthase reductase